MELLPLLLIALLVLINIWLSLRGRKAPADQALTERLIRLESMLDRSDSLSREEFLRNRQELQQSIRESRTELNLSFRNFSEQLTRQLAELLQSQKSQFTDFTRQLAELVKTLDEKQQRLMTQQEIHFKGNRQELTAALKSFEEQFTLNVKAFNDLQRQKFADLNDRQEKLRQDAEGQLTAIRETMERRLQQLQEENGRKLDDMRKVVDEKLQEAVEKRFNESFRMISERLEQVHKGLGEMQSLASGVGDLKKVLTNVKTRGSLGEIQLGAILEQILSPEQYVLNSAVKTGSAERVEYAIKLPGRSTDNEPLLLPVDSKFPNEDYQRLVEAYEQPGTKELEIISRQFENAVRKNAREIRDKYINPPVTTDFAIMFVPTEGLYAEILRRTGLFEQLQREFKITVVGPTNLVAFLSSLQMGFKTLAIEKRSSEVWEVLGAVKTEFGSFGSILEKTRKKLQEAANVIDKAGVRSRAIERKLRNVQELPAEDSFALLDDSPDNEADEADSDDEGDDAAVTEQ